MRQAAIIPLILLAFQTLPAYAKVFDLFPRSNNIERLVDDATWIIADRQSDPVDRIPKRRARVSAKRSSDPAASFDGAAFNITATQACTLAVKSYAKAINPSGVICCYNVAFYDNTTGIFETDVRFYQKNEPSGDFTGANPSDYSLGMSLPQASLSAPVSILKSVSTASSPANGQFLQGFQMIGQMNSGLTLSELTVSDLRVLMIPTITLTVQNTTTHTLVNTTLSSDTFSYVAGELVQSNGLPTNITVPEAVAQASPIVSSVSKFVLPGTQIKIFPTGLIITSIWTAIFGTAVGFGTFERYRFRQHYRTRVSRAMVGNM